MRRSIGRHLGALVTCSLTIIACDGSITSGADIGAVGGSIVVAAQTEPRTLLPPLLAAIDEKLVSEQVFEPLAWLGDEGHLDRGYRPAIADSWSWENDSLAIVFQLNPRARWQDGTALRASDVRFTFDLFNDSIVGYKDRASLGRIDSVTVRDSLTAVFWFDGRYPEQFFDAASRMAIVPEHLLAKEPRATLLTAAIGRQPVGSGRFRVANWAAGSSIELVADTNHYRARPKLDRIIFTLVSDANALGARLTTGDIDVGEVTTPDLFRSLATRPELKAQINPAYDYAFLLFNIRERKSRTKPNTLFADPALRRALSMALDRDVLVRSQFDSLGIAAIGPMTRAQPLADSTVPPIKYDSAAAARLLDSLGWTIPAGKTIRERNGKPLRFAVMTPTVSRNRMTMVVRVQEVFKRIGVDMEVDAIDGNAFISRLGARDFDVAFDGRRVDLSISGLRAYWSVASAKDPTGQNFGNYQNPLFDAHLDSALGASDASTARAHARQAFTTIIADAPAAWLYEVRSATLIHKRIRTAHIVPTAWWAGMADWYIPSNERIDRDRVGLRKVAARQ
jgi:peptide/nickel transport system substrate-binding protein